MYYSFYLVLEKLIKHLCVSCVYACVLCYSIFYLKKLVVYVHVGKASCVYCVMQRACASMLFIF